ncbi:MAG: Type 1 glutamine amidotransferase-like domain-containing protein [Desulfobacterales bacterium]|jgi:cyanophycinase
MGTIFLAGGAEFGGDMASPDRRALELAGGSSARVSIIPAAAAPDNNHRRAAKNGVRWFRSLGATDVKALPLIDRVSADDPGVVRDLHQSTFIYIPGGYPRYLEQALTGSVGWAAILEAYQNGAVVAGSSAGAMVLCSHYFDPDTDQVHQGLGLVPNTCFLPHHSAFGHQWVPRLAALLPTTVTLIGVDEETAILSGAAGEKWEVSGKGEATVYNASSTERYKDGAVFLLHGQSGSILC